MSDFDIAIIGGGIVGASIAYALGGRAKVLLLEAESAPGYHATGRSAALFAESYGPDGIRALTRASRAFFVAPPPEFASVPLLRPRGALMVGSAGQHDQLLSLERTLLAEGVQAQRLEGQALYDRVPVLRPEAIDRGVLDPGAQDIEVDALLQGFLRGARGQGAQLLTQARVTALERTADGWRLTTAAGQVCTARQVVNAAGAWADEVAKRAGVTAIGLEPRRRSAFLFEPPAGVDASGWPAVIAIDETWYFKPDAGLILGSPANQDPTHPHDVVAEEFDVALGIHHIECATTLTIRRPRSTWAGLRSFAPDGEPVCGFDPSQPGFFWAAALGGYGIQTSPAFGRLCAALLLAEAVPPDIAAQGLRLATIAVRSAVAPA